MFYVGVLRCGQLISGGVLRCPAESCGVLRVRSLAGEWERRRILSQTSQVDLLIMGWGLVGVSAHAFSRQPNQLAWASCCPPLVCLLSACGSLDSDRAVPPIDLEHQRD